MQELVFCGTCSSQIHAADTLKYVLGHSITAENDWESKAESSF